MENMEGIVEEELVVAENKSSVDLDETIDHNNIIEGTLDQPEFVTEADIDNSTENFADTNDLHQGEFLFSESSSEDESDEKITKDDVYVNVVGKKLTDEDFLHAIEMKQNMKEFFMKCSPDVSFSTLVQFFVQRLPQPKPVYVLASDVCPKNLDPSRKYAIVCAVSNCENAYIRDGSDWESIEQTKNFFGFPPNSEQCKMWINSIGRLKYLKRNAEEIQNYRVCEVHFTPEDFTSEYKDELTESAVPSLFVSLGQETPLEETAADEE